MAERCRADRACEVTGLKLRHIQTLAARGDIPGAEKIMGHWTFHEATLRRWIREQEVVHSVDELRRRITTPDALRTKARVYFIRSDSGPIKIGASVNPEVRLQDLQNSSPEKLCLMGHIHGGFELERLIHEKFGAYRMHGEWFRPEEDLLSFIRGGLEPWLSPPP